MKIALSPSITDSPVGSFVILGAGTGVGAGVGSGVGSGEAVSSGAGAASATTIRKLKVLSPSAVLTLSSKL